MALVAPLDRALDSLGYHESDGLVLNGASTGIVARDFVWRDLRDKCEVDAAYFVGAVPLVAFAGAENLAAVQTIHQRLWNFSRVPLLIAGTPDDIAAYSCFVAPSRAVDDTSAMLRSASAKDDVSEALGEFERASVEGGRLSTLYPNKFLKRDRVDQRLLQGLRHLRRGLSSDEHRQRAFDALIGRSMFVRYLEDRGILSADHVGELVPFESFLETLEAGVGPTYELFGQLAERFNGDIFAFPRNESAVVEERDLSVLASFFRGDDLATGQQSLWPYDFSIIPPDLISSIYEQLLEESQRRDAAYYTPRHVVNLILDEVLEWDSTGGLTALDPACGSGAFLTELYRRLVFRRLSLSEEASSFDNLVALLTSSIFGVDRSANAISVAAFGLYLALLEEVDPPTAWREAKLPRLLDSNLVVADFFADHPLGDRRFDIVVGNPPWQSALSDAARDYLTEAGVSVPDQQMALAFAWRAGDMLTESGKLGLLLPAKPFLHNKSPRAVAARRGIFETLDVETVIDLSALRHETFDAAVAPAAVLIAKQRRGGTRDPFRDDIVHAVARNSPLQTTVDGFVISQDDIHLVRRELADSEPDLWKVYLWGSERDRRLIEKLRRRFPTLKDVAATRGWTRGQGFQIKGGDSNDASHLVGMTFIPTEAVTPFRIDGDALTSVTASTMHRPRDPRLFKGPHVLVRRGLVKGRLAAAFVGTDAAFNNGVLGIAGSRSDAKYLKWLVAVLNSSLGNYYHFMTSSSWGVEREFVEVGEHLSLPIPFPSDGVDSLLRSVPLKEIEVSAGPWEELDNAVFDAYALTESERTLIKDAVAIALDQYDRRIGADAFRPPGKAELRSYLRSFRAALKGSLRSVGVDVRVASETSAHLVVTIVFDVGPDQTPRGPGIPDQWVGFANARSEWPSPATIVQPVGIVADGNAVSLLKPNELRYWTRSAAEADAADIVGVVGVLPTADL